MPLFLGGHLKNPPLVMSPFRTLEYSEYKSTPTEHKHLHLASYVSIRMQRNDIKHYVTVLTLSCTISNKPYGHAIRNKASILIGTACDVIALHSNRIPALSHVLTNYA